MKQRAEIGSVASNGDFDVDDRPREGRPKTFEDAELEALLDEDPCQTQEELASVLGVTRQAISKRLHALGMIQKQGTWVPYELKPRDVERRFFVCEQLLQRQKRKGFLHCIVTGDEKWIHYNNPKRRKSWGLPRSCFYVDASAEYSRCEGYAVYLVGPGRCYLL